jgi:hypothetical protein
VYHHQPRSRVPFLSVRAKVPRLVDAPTSLALKVLVVSSLILEGADPSTMSGHLLSATWSKSRLFTSWPPVRWFVRGPYKIYEYFCFLDVAAVPGIGPLCRCCIAVASVISSLKSVLYGSRLQRRPCLVLKDRVSCAVQERRDGSTVLGQHLISAWYHHRLGSVPPAIGDALSLDAGPHIGSPVLWEFPLRPLH